MSLNPQASPGRDGAAVDDVVYLERPARAPLPARLARLANRVGLDLPLVVLDAALSSVAYLAILVLRFDGSVPGEFWSGFGRYLPLAVLAHVGANWLWGLYRQMWQHASIREARRVLLAGATAGAVLLPTYFAMGRPVPFSVSLLGGLVATMLMGVIRFQSRLFALRRNSEVNTGLRVAVVGAGEAGAAVVREMQRDRVAGLRPIVFLDDDPHKSGLSLLGVPVVGPVDDLMSVVEREQIHQVLLAVPSASQDLVRRVASIAEAAAVPLKVAPGLGELLRGRISLRDVRDLRIEDLLGRQQVDTDLAGVHRLLGGRRVLITGGGGSIGSEIARQVAESGPATLVLLDHDETHLHDAASFLDRPAITELCDIVDVDSTRRIFDRHRPDIVFHAAAHKHVPILESHPREALKTNVLGTLNVMEAAEGVGAERVVFISTDKAVRPSSVMGASKWLGEQIVLNSTPRGGRYCAVRFGNVLGSRGSVIPTFARQIAAGGPVTVTDPRMTRYFMSVEEAVQLVLQSAVFAEGRDVFMLEMGEPANILELAERMIRLSGYSVDAEIPIEIVGCRPGEKLVEELREPDEPCFPTAHQGVLRLEPSRIDAGLLQDVLVRVKGMARGTNHAQVANGLVDLANGWPQAILSERVVDLTAVERSESWSQSSI